MAAAFEECIAQLERDGYCVVPDVLTEEQADEGASRMWDWLESMAPGHLNRNDPSTWTNKNLPYRLHGIIQQYYAGHQQYVWDLRDIPRVGECFAELWSVKLEKELTRDDMLVSFDAVNITLPWESNAQKSKVWPHSDQRATVKGFACAQGFLNLQHTTEDDGCLVVWRGSHHLHARYCEERKEYLEEKGVNLNRDWIKLPDRDASWFEERGCEMVRVAAPKGSLVLWDSRAIHCNSQARQGRKTLRQVVYVCMVPREFATDRQLEKKWDNFVLKRTTSHWPHRGARFSLHPMRNRVKGSVIDLEALRPPTVLATVSMARMAGREPPVIRMKKKSKKKQQAKASKIAEAGEEEEICIA